MEEIDAPLKSKENADMRLDETKSDTVEDCSISSPSDAPVGVTFLKEVSLHHKPEDEVTSPKAPSRNEIGKASLSEEFFMSLSYTGSVDRLKLFEAQVNKKSPTPSFIEEQCIDSRLCNKHSNLESEETYSTSISATSHGKSSLLEMPTGYETKDVSLLPNKASLSNEITQTKLSDKPSNTNADHESPYRAASFSRTKENDGLPISLNSSSLDDGFNNNENPSNTNIDHEFSDPTKIFFGTMEKDGLTFSLISSCLDDGCNKNEDFSNINANYKSPDPATPFSGTKENEGLLFSLYSCSLDDDCKNNEYPFRTNRDHESPNPTTAFSGAKENEGSPFSLSSSSMDDDCNINKDPSNTNRDHESPYPTMTFSGTMGKDGLSFNLTSSPLDDDCTSDEDLDNFNKKEICLNSTEIIKKSSENTTPKGEIRNSDSVETRPLSTIEDIFNRNQPLEELSNDYKLEDTSFASKVLFPNDSYQPVSPKITSSSCQTDISSREPRIASPYIDDSDSNFSDYYDDDDDLDRYVHEVRAMGKEKMEAEALKNDNCNWMGEIIYSSASVASSEENCGTSTSKIILKSPEPTVNSFSWPVATSSENTRSRGLLNEPDLLMQVQKFFSDHPVAGKMTCLNGIFTSKYFTDEIAQQRQLTADEYGKITIVNEQHGSTVEEYEMITIGNELDGDTAAEMEIREPDSYLKRCGRLLEWRPFSFQMMLLKYYMSLHNSYSY